MEYNPQLHRRRSIRYKGYDYSQEGAYFLTLNIFKRQHLLGQIHKGHMHLNCFGKIVAEEWKRTAEIRANVNLGEFIIMPNHIHGIVEINYPINKKTQEELGKFKSPSHSIGAIVRGFKGATTKKIRKILDCEEAEIMSLLDFGPSSDKIGDACILGFSPNVYEIDFPSSIWQRNYFEHIIRNQRAYQSISAYIRNNPRRWSKKHGL